MSTTQVEKEEDERSIATNKTARDSGEGETQYLSFDFVFRAQASETRIIGEYTAKKSLSETLQPPGRSK